MKRRNFLKMFPALGVTPVAINGFPLRPFANRKMANILAGCDGVEDRVLILIQMKGGNDGLNTVIPISRYDRYAALRPTTKIKDTGTDKFITLDSTLPVKDQIGIHPAMTSFKALYDKGIAAVVQGVGYQNINQSHFKGTDIWLSGGGGSYALNNLTTGWMGRTLQAFYPESVGVPTKEMPDPLGIQIGDPNTSLGFHTETEHQNVINLSGQDPAGFYSLIQTIGGAPLKDVPDSDHGDELAYIMGVEQSINLYAKRISDVFNKGKNALTTYPNSSLAAQLRTVARMIHGGSKTKIFLCSIGGFDTHSAQVDSGNTSIGSHANLLRSLSDAVKAFYDDLELMGIGDRVAACTFSEFGRCAKENGSFGTDHGTLSPMFLFGKGVRAHVHGTNVNLDDLTTDNQLKNMQFDYRQVFGTLLQDWLGANSYVLEQSMFEGYKQMFLVDKAYTVKPDCYWGGSPVIADPFRPTLHAWPNPAHFSTEVVYESDSQFEGVLSMHSMGGTVVSSSREQINPGTNMFYLDVSTLNAGYYIVRLENKSNGKGEILKLSVVR